MVNYHYCLAGLTGRNKGNISNCNVNFNAEINFYKNVSYHIGILSVINEGNITNCAVKCNAIFTGNLKSAEYEGVNYHQSVHPYFTFGTITTYYYMFIGSFGEYQIGSASNCFISCNLINEVDLGPYSSASVFGVGENDDQNYSQIYYEGNIYPLETENDNIIFV